MKKQVLRTVSNVLGVVMGCSICLTACGANEDNSNTGDSGNVTKKDSIVIMTEELSGLFNPFYATSGTDMDVVGMTQIGMLATDSAGNPTAGDDEPTVVKDFEVKHINQGQTNEKTVYTFVIKNNLKFSDGHALTMNDVMFNIYEYLDPVYTGSSTMYSIDIEGLSTYRTQQNLSDNSGMDAQISNKAAGLARNRKDELYNLYKARGLVAGSTSSYNMDAEKIKTEINNWPISAGYKSAVATTKEQATLTDADYRAMLWADYELTAKTFKEELQADYKAAKESFDLTTAPYNEWVSDLSNDVFKFFLYEGYIKPEYAKDPKNPSKDDKTKIVKFTGTEIVASYATEEAAINRVYNDNINTALLDILTRWGTAGTLTTIYTAEATDVILHENMDGDSLRYPNISGVVSLGHTSSQSSVTLANDDGTTDTYAVAHTHDANGVPTNANEYDVLQITVNGTDPKAIYNFGFTVAPAHYYASKTGDGTDVLIDIPNNKFGVEYASSEFQSKVIQSQRHVEVPVGAGPFMATDKDNNTNPGGDKFWASNIVYFKSNPNFMFPVKAPKLQMQVVSSTNAIDKLANGEVDYITPQFTMANSKRLTEMEKSGFVQLSSWQLGYGYIGINAGKVPNINIRRAIMSAMQTSLALEYYEPGTCKTISWPMSTVSWAYPFETDGKTSKDNGHDYTDWKGKDAAETKIKKYMNAAGVTAGSSELKIKFTIAGASITEHPTYTVFKQAAEILNEMGWQVEVKADSQALTKLSTGSLEVWAAAWGSTIDPDMYQVYHKNSSATSVYAWGYREIKANQTLYREEYRIINELSKIIDKARSIDDQATRKRDYEQAMGLVLDLAVEMPVYQRKALYAYNGNTLKGLRDTVNSYTSPLEKIWDIELKNN